ncbi:MAG TPA: hypothetical protein VGD41_14680 [Pyrinomonadaceae bacterium]
MSVITVQLIVPEKIYRRIREDQLVSLAHAEVEVAAGNANSTAGGNQPKMLTEEM